MGIERTLPLIRIANGAGFLGDNLDAPRLVVEGAEVDYLTLEYLAELTLSILARAAGKKSGGGICQRFRHGAGEAFARH